MEKALRDGIEALIEREVEQAAELQRKAKTVLEDADRALHTPHPGLSGKAEHDRQVSDSQAIGMGAENLMRKANDIYEQIKGKREVLAAVNKVLAAFEKQHGG
ncbi:MAG: hypothetical protein JSR45_18460 [Proteobacteria bacterium]|nr:hypothetical protein [Pseudomonadota bacterium]